MPALHGVLLVTVCLTDIEGIVQRVGIVDFPLTVLASPVLMNVDVSAFWVVLYYLFFGTFFWWLVGRLIDRLFAG
jgi:hypothetical protein